MSETRHYSHYEAGDKALTVYYKFQTKTLLPLEIKYLEGIKVIEKKVGGCKKEMNKC